jgi:OOP family OmpA-OmpF porin
MKRRVLCLFIILVAASMTASASDTGFYLGAGIGQAAIEILDFYPSLGDFVESPTPGYTAYGGYRFLKFLAVEAGYADLGSPQWQERNVQGYQERAEVSIQGWDTFVVAILPVSNVVDIYGKLGIMAWETEITSFLRGDYISSESSSGTDTAYGIGAGFWVGPNVTLRGEAEWFKIGDYSTVPFYSFKLTYTF